MPERAAPRALGIEPDAPDGGGPKHAPLRPGVLLAVLAGLVAALIAGLALAAPAAGISTRYEQEARETAIEVSAAAQELAELRAAGSSDPAAIGAAGQRFERAADRACALMRTYRGARTRYGNKAEVDAVEAMLKGLLTGRRDLATVSGIPAPAPSARDRARARTAARQAITRGLLADLVERRLKDVGLANALRAGDLKRTKRQLGTRLVRRLRTSGQLNPIAAEVAQGLVLGAPLKQQARAQVRRAADRLLARLVLRATPKGWVVKLAGQTVLPLLRRAFRGLTRSGLSKRTAVSARSLRLHLRTLRNTSDPDANLGVVERRVERAQRAVAATRFLRRDLARAGRTAALRRHDRLVKSLQARIRLVFRRYLLDSDLVLLINRNLTKEVCDEAGRIRRMREAYAPTPAPGSGSGSCAVSLTLDDRQLGGLQGKPGVSGSATIDLRTNPKVGRVQAFLTASITGAQGGGGPPPPKPVITHAWVNFPSDDSRIFGQGRPDGLDIVEDTEAGRSTPDAIEGMFLNLGDEFLLANNPFYFRLILIARDADGAGVPTHLGGLCTLA